MSEGAQMGSAGGVLAATCISTLVVNANTSAVSILLPAISEDTGTSLEHPAVGGDRLLPGGGRGHHHHRLAGRRLRPQADLQLGLLLFVVSCVLIALAQIGRHGHRRTAIQGAPAPRSWPAG